MNENQNTNKINQANSEAAAKAEPKTVINGKVVSLQQAQAMEQAFNESVSKTGIQAHHDNSTEAVNAGEVAKSASTAEAGAAQQYNQQAIKQTDVQSGQAHLQEFEGQAHQAQQQAQQHAQNNTQAVNAAAQQHTESNAAGAAAQQAADSQKAAARAKKGQ
jgi:hypothetical protein